MTTEPNKSSKLTLELDLLLVLCALSGVQLEQKAGKYFGLGGGGGGGGGEVSLAKPFI